jgi:hypothetical protein
MLFLIFGIPLLGSLISFLGDYRWFQDLGYTGTFLTRLRMQLIIGIPLFAVIFSLLTLYVLKVKGRYLRDTALIFDTASESKINRLIRIAVAVVSVFGSFSVTKSIWFDVLTFVNGQKFNLVDPIFSKDISFYVFRLPFYSGLLGILMSVMVIMLVVNIAVASLIAGYQNLNQPGGDTIFEAGWGAKTSEIGKMIGSPSSQKIFQGAKGSIIGLLLLGAARFWLSTYQILYSTRGEVFGAGYTDMIITLNVYRMLAVVCLISAVFVILRGIKMNLRQLFWIPAILTMTFLLGGIAGGLVQSLIVSPDEISKERIYIQNNIEMTRTAYGLDQIREIDFPVEYNLTAADIQANRDIVENIRINDYSPVKQVYNQIQGIRPYYVFNDVDIDRYMIDGKYTQVFLSARELDQHRIDAQAQNWINLVLKYTHGYGIALSPVNRVTTEGQPLLTVRDIPPRTTTDFSITRPEIYFGESTNSYIIVNTDEEEFDYPFGSDNMMTTYEGDAGIKLSFINRLLFTIKQRDIRILISNNIDGNSRIILNRNIIQRVKKVAPFLAYGHDPYIVVNQDNGRVYWIVDAFTFTDRYPYALPFEGANFNYIRNSVKVVIDAYNGTTDFYVADSSDAIVQTYRKIFPDLFKDMGEMPAGVRQHIRYCQDYFDIQSEIFRTYHMQNPNVFFGKEDLWEISKEKYLDKVQTVESNYLMFQLPEEDDVEFLISVPYSPVGRNNMSTMLVGRCDGDQYGELLIYRFPRSENIAGPNMIESRIDQESDISPQLTLWSQEGSSVLRGNIIIIPIKDSLLYIEPIYLRSSGENALPEMQRVIAAYENKIVMERTLESALNAIFGKSDDGGQNGGTDIDEKTMRELILEANTVYQQAQEALKSGDWNRYGELMRRLEQVLERLAVLPFATD